MQEAADAGGMNGKAAFGQRRRQPMQRHVRVAGNLAKYEQPMIPADQMRPVPPILPGATLPLTRLRAAHLTTLDTATRRAAATSRVVPPASRRAIASSRRSIEYGFDMKTDLQRSAHRI
jgi:hypothetical protein